MNEVRFVRWLARRVRPAGSAPVGIGHDAALVRGGPGRCRVLKADAVIEGTHFTRSTGRPGDWGWKAVMKSASDFAACGARPGHLLVSAGVPAREPEGTLRGIYSGIFRAARRIGACIVGGDTSRSPVIFLSVMMSGEPVGRGILTRAGARPGDGIWVSGRLGGSFASGRHLRFVPRLAESEFLVNNYRLSAMMDLTDGLAKDLREIAFHSRVGVSIDERLIPLHRDARGVGAAWREGEDFELLFVLSPAEERRLECDRRIARAGFVFSRIGRVTRAGLECVGLDEKKKPFPKIRDHHFGAF